METIFKQPRKNMFFLFDKTEGDFDESTVERTEEAIEFNVETSLTDRQKGYIEICQKKDVTTVNAEDSKMFMQLEFEEDIYCIAFLKFITSNDPILHRELMLKCACTYIF